MIFSFPNTETVNTEDAVKTFLEIIQEKSRIMEASRLGRFVEGSSRPILLSVGSSIVANQIVWKRRFLQDCVHFP